MPFVIGGGSGGSGSLSVRDEFIFATTIARDDYFTLNPSKLQESIYVSVNGELQKYVGGTFVDVTPVIRGGRGADAPSMLIQYSATGNSGWSNTLNTATHKYWRWSTDGGATWSADFVKFSGTGSSAGVPEPYSMIVGGNGNYLS